MRFPILFSFGYLPLKPCSSIVAIMDHFPSKHKDISRLIVPSTDDRPDPRIILHGCCGCDGRTVGLEVTVSMYRFRF
jgi:hypothetical protein